MLQGEHWRVTNEHQRANLVRHIMAEEMPFRAQVLPTERSLDQNSLSHVWYGEIAKRDKQYNTITARRMCKLHFGVPIMRAGSDEFRQAWDGMVKARFTYEEKLALMDWWPVTSLMDRAQMTEYLTAMQAHFAEKGIVLTGLDRGAMSYPEAKRA